MKRLLAALGLALICACASAQTVVNTQSPISDFQINGIPAVGGKLFVYQAGTTTKTNTYTDSTGLTPNTNPIIFNSRGEPENGSGASVGIWIPPGTTYKLVFAPSTDSDPPSSPIWTVDNLNSSGVVLPLSIAQGGTGATTAAGALSNLGVPTFYVGNYASIQSAINAAQAANGGKVVLTPGTIYSISSTLTITVSNVSLLCDHPASMAYHTIAPPITGCWLKWTGASHGTMMSIIPPTGSSTNGFLTGNVVEGINFEGNSAASFGLVVESQFLGRFGNLFLQDFITGGSIGGSTGAAFYFGTVQPTSSSQFGDPCDSQDNYIHDVQINNLLTNAVGFYTDTWLNAGITNGGCNFSFNTVLNMKVLGVGQGVILDGADNNRFINLHVFESSGATIATDFQIKTVAALTFSAAANQIFGYSTNGVTKAEGTSEVPACTAYAGSVVSTLCTWGNIIYGLDKANSTPDPTIDTNAQLTWYNSDGSGGGTVASPVLAIGDSFAAEWAARAAIGTTSLYIRNSSGDHIRVSDGTNVWGINLDGNKLRLNAVSGGGSVVEVPALASTAAIASGGVGGVTCSGTPTASFASTGGVVTHC